ncbi:hypothetical protein [Vibrio nigripulchritudo]|uniref:hypothetical protein n=1 Tax=Vibrio nigripulchritudo TaxID=28173 RepID=UPI0024921E58|nr:hypothetical protein [Vibrio nigripulchritudo]BDU42885.1 hypothetical protein TUMSATVNIG3_16830 [Vibrio nigripulchritudo]
MSFLLDPQDEREITNLLSPHDVGFICAQKQPTTKTADNITALESGFFSSDYFTEWASAELEHQKAYDQWHFVRTKDSAVQGKAHLEHLREAAAQAERLGSSKGAKVGQKKPAQRLRTMRKLGRRSPVLESSDCFYGHGQLLEKSATESRVLPLRTERNQHFVDKNPTVVQVQRREWSGQWRIQQVTTPSVGDAPDANLGERFTEKLTSRAVTKIFESGAYVATCHGGFKTFGTLTFDEARRRRVLDGTDLTDDGLAFSPVKFKRNYGMPTTEVAGAFTAVEFVRKRKKYFAINKGLVPWSQDVAGAFTPLWLKPEKPFDIIRAQTSIGQEVSRFVNALKKLFSRGFVESIVERNEDSKLYCPLPRPDFHFLPNREPFHFLWVAECPMNEDGEPNPHVHFLMKWDMPEELFLTWANRIERLWGNGFARLEPIKRPEAAGSYIIKAVGYAAKGDNGDQGLIKGNRYGMAACSRAPAWEALATFEADNMAGIIKELGYKLDQWKKPILRSIARTEKAHEQTIKSAGIAKGKGDEVKVIKLRHRLTRLENQIKQDRQTLKRPDYHASSGNRFSLTFDRHAELRLNQFLSWAVGARGWSMQCRENVDFSDIKEDAKAHYQHEFTRFLDSQCEWKSQLKQSLPAEPCDAEKDAQTAYFYRLWDEHTQLAIH